jgi:Protein of unknown function (DUF2442)
MLPSVVSVTQTGPYRLKLRFDDGAEGEIDITKMTTFEGVFEPLKDPGYFSQVKVDPEAGTIVWPNGADLDPLVLHSKVTGLPITFDVPSQQVG